MALTRGARAARERRWKGELGFGRVAGASPATGRSQTALLGVNRHPGDRTGPLSSQACEGRHAWTFPLTDRPECRCDRQAAASATLLRLSRTSGLHIAVGQTAPSPGIAKERSGRCAVHADSCAHIHQRRQLPSSFASSGQGKTPGEPKRQLSRFAQGARVVSLATWPLPGCMMGAQRPGPACDVDFVLLVRARRDRDAISLLPRWLPVRAPRGTRL